MLSNLPPGVTDATIDDLYRRDECEDCPRYERCGFDYDLRACWADAMDDVADRAIDAARDEDL
jgi:hypothetical protein